MGADDFILQYGEVELVKFMAAQGQLPQSPRVIRKGKVKGAEFNEEAKNQFRDSLAVKTY